MLARWLLGSLALGAALACGSTSNDDKGSSDASSDTGGSTGGQNGNTNGAGNAVSTDGDASTSSGASSATGNDSTASTTTGAGGDSTASGTTGTGGDSTASGTTGTGGATNGSGGAGGASASTSVLNDVVSTASNTSGNSGGSGGTASACPEAVPEDGADCTGIGLLCAYEDCAGAGRSIARCNGSTWQLDVGPCGDTVWCTGGVGSGCTSGQVCLVLAGGALFETCVDNTCEDGAVSCDCIEGCAGQCSVYGDVDYGVTISCNTCPEGTCP